MHICDAKLEHTWITSDVTHKQRIAREIAIGPHDEAQMRILHSEERLEYIPVAHQRQPSHCTNRYSSSCMVGLIQLLRRTVMGRLCLKIVAVETMAHGHASMDFGNTGTIQLLSDIIDWGNLLGLETPSQGH